MVFRLSWTLTRKTCVLTGTYLAGLSKLLFTCPEEHFQSTISESKSWKLQDFRIIFEVFGTMAEKFFRVGKTVKDVQGNSLRKKFFIKRKFRFFSDSERFSYFWRKTLPDLRKSQSTYTWKFLGKNLFWNLINLSHLLGLWSKKRSVGKFIHELSQLQSERPETFFD